MSGFEYYNSHGVLTIDSNNKSIGISQYMGNPGLIDIGSVRFVSGTAFGDGSNLGWLPDNFFPSSGMRWWRPLANGGWGMPGGGLYTPGSGDFMVTSPYTALQSGFLDVFDGGGNLVWSAASAGSMPRIIEFFSVGAGYDLTNGATFQTSFANPWICSSQWPGESSGAGDSGGYSGIIIRRNNAQNFTLYYINRNQNNYLTAMGNYGINIALAYFTGY